MFTVSVRWVITEAAMPGTPAQLYVVQVGEGKMKHIQYSNVGGIESQGGRFGIFMDWKVGP